MEAPRHICEALYKLHQQARLGWVGADRLSPDEDLNKGQFALLQLYHRRDAERTYYGDPWNDRGPVFGRPYDRLMRVPIMLHLIHPQDVFSGKVIFDVKRWMMPIRERVELAAVERGKAYQDELDNLAGEIGSEMYWSAHNGGSATINTPYKDLTAEDKAVLGGETIRGVENTFVDNLKTGAPPIA